MPGIQGGWRRHSLGQRDRPQRMRDLPPELRRGPLPGGGRHPRHIPRAECLLRHRRCWIPLPGILCCRVPQGIRGRARDALLRGAPHHPREGAAHRVPGECEEPQDPRRRAHLQRHTLLPRGGGIRRRRARAQHDGIRRDPPEQGEDLCRRLQEESRRLLPGDGRVQIPGAREAREGHPRPDRRPREEAGIALLQA